MGAWIETFSICNASGSKSSHPMWVRGLKLDWAHLDEIKEKSHPMWVRGLKLSSLVRDCFSA